MPDQSPLRQLPAIHALLGEPAGQALIDLGGHDLAVEALRLELDNARADLLAGGGLGPAPGHNVLIEAARQRVDSWLAPTLRRVINATGVIIHTNLGRAPLADSALTAMETVGGGYSTLEFDIETGARGHRSTHAAALIQRLTGAEAAFVVNNNASATMLVLAVLAGPTPDHPAGRGVVVSRGQLVEIGGGYRMPDVMSASGARMVEVGTTNRTHLYDYERAINEDTAMLMRVHHSNYAIIGFTSQPALEDLIALGNERGIIVVDDIGSGALFDTTQFGLAPEPHVQDSIEHGIDVVMFSGDKLLGGPQAGIIVGKAEHIERVKRHPLARAVRPDKLALAALTATLTHYLRGDALIEIPVWRMISMPLGTIHETALRWAAELREAGLEADVMPGESTVGGGSLPGETLPTHLLAVTVASEEKAAEQLRALDVPIITRRIEGLILIDPRTVLPRDEDDLIAGLIDGLTS